eukprot:2197644-Prymnesium_polylepis.1
MDQGEPQRCRLRAPHDRPAGPQRKRLLGNKRVPNGENGSFHSKQKPHGETHPSMLHTEQQPVTLTSSQLNPHTP